MRLHFLNVGHGDCCIIEFDSGRKAIVDINRSSEFDEETVNEIIQESSLSFNSKGTLETYFQLGVVDYNYVLEKCGYDIQLTDPIEYLQDNNITSIFRFVSTHPHMDHLAGLNSIKNDMFNIWICDNQFTQDNDLLSESQKEDWSAYLQFRDNIGGDVNGIKVLDIREGASGDYYKQDGISILAPNDNLLELAEDKGNQNIMSTVLLITYGNCKIILGGDAEGDTWEHIKGSYPDEISNVSILKAAHHGRDSGYHQEAVKLMSPEYTIVSVGKKPKTDASNKYRQYSKHVYSTRWKGNIVFDCYLDGTVIPTCEYDR